MDTSHNFLFFKKINQFIIIIIIILPIVWDFISQTRDQTQSTTVKALHSNH